MGYRYIHIYNIYIYSLRVHLKKTRAKLAVSLLFLQLVIQLMYRRKRPKNRRPYKGARKVACQASLEGGEGMVIC